MNKTTLIVIGVIVLVIVVVLVRKPVILGGPIHNIQQTFVPGITLGATQEVPCFKIMDTDKAAWSYVTVLNGTMTTTGGTDGQFTVPTSCAGK